MLSNFTFLSLLLVTSLSWGQAPEIPRGGVKIPDAKGKAIVERTIDELRPGQAVVGYIQITKDKKELLEMREGNTLDAHLRERAVPLMKTPDGKLFMLDGHHMVRSYYEIAEEERAKVLRETGNPAPPAKVYTYIAFDYSKDPDLKDLEKFKKYAADHAFVYLLDAQGKKITDLYALPKHIKDLTDDPYRALAKEVLKNKGFDKTDTSHAELYWGDLFRTELRKQGITNVVVQEKDKNNVLKDKVSKDAIQRAMVIAADPRISRGMPGFKSGAINDALPGVDRDHNAPAPPAAGAR